MACEAFYSILTPSTTAHEAHHSTQYLNTCSFLGRWKPSLVSPRRRPFSTSASKSKPAGSGKTRKKVKDDPWESLFKQLEKDLENDTEDTSEKEITEEDVANFERELDMIVEELENVSNTSTTSELDDMLRTHNKDTNKDDDDSDNDDKEGIKAKKVNANEGVDDHDEDKDDDDDRETECDDDYFSDDDFEDPRKVPLERWQLRKLAAAVELGRRKVHVKSLAAELQLDRDDVLSFLKNPPPELLMAASEMEERGEDDEPVSDEEDITPDKGQTNDFLLLKDPDADQAVSSMKDDLYSQELKRRTFGPRDWIRGKRIKKVNLATLQLVYKKAKWPSNAMIESVVRATNLPRVRVLKWFEEERAKSGTKEPPRQSADSRKAWKRPVTHSFERLR